MVVIAAISVVAVTQRGPSATIPAGPSTTTQQPARPYGVQVTLPFAGLHNPVGVAVDSAGTVYVADSNNDRVLKLAAGSSDQTVLPFSGLLGPYGLAVDSAGTVYVADIYNDRVVSLAAGSSTQTVLPFTGLREATGVAVDSVGTVYVTDKSNNRVLMLPAA
jgi:serine/threonine-protein kinase